MWANGAVWYTLSLEMKQILDLLFLVYVPKTQLNIGFGQIHRIKLLNYMIFILKPEVNDGIRCSRDKQACLSQAMLPLKQPAIPHQDLTTAYLPTLGDSTRTN